MGADRCKITNSNCYANKTVMFSNVETVILSIYNKSIGKICFFQLNCFCYPIQSFQTDYNSTLFIIQEFLKSYSKSLHYQPYTQFDIFKKIKQSFTKIVNVNRSDPLFLLFWDNYRPLTLQLATTTIVAQTLCTNVWKSQFLDSTKKSQLSLN